METNYKDLKSLFINDTSLAIEYCQVIISTTAKFESFNDFYNYHLKNSQISTCQKEWSNQMAISCKNCQNCENSIICLECFLNGNHQGHDYQISLSSSGNCDCGDLSQWKRSGFCSKHHGLEEDSHPENYLDEQLRTLLTDIVYKSSFKAIKHLPSDDCATVTQILQFLISFLKFGDGFRRLLAISLTEKINFYHFFEVLFGRSSKFNAEILKFLGLLVNDQLFKDNFAMVNYQLQIEKIIPRTFVLMRGLIDIPNMHIIDYDRFWFHSFSKQTIQNSIEKRGWDWITFTNLTLSFMKELFNVKKYNQFAITDNIPSVFSDIYSLKYAAELQPNEPTQNFFDLFVTRVLTCGTSIGIRAHFDDTIIVSSFHPNEAKIGSISFIINFDFCFFRAIEFFKSKKNLKIDSLFDELDKSFDISPIFLIGKNVVGKGEKENENDKYISYLFKNLNKIDNIVDYHYKSFPNGASFFMTHPMFVSLAYLLRNDNLCRIKVAKILSQKKFQCLRIRLGIATLKRISAIVCSSESLVPKDNVNLFIYISCCTKKRFFTSFGIPLYLPLLQLLVGIRCDQQYYGMNEFSLKDFFAFEMAREIGLFDVNIDNDRADFNSTKKQMIFIFFYLSLLLVIERTLFNFDPYQFTREQIVFFLKKGVSDLNDLNNLYDKRIGDSFDVNKIIAEVSTPRQNKSSHSKSSIDQDVSFELKKGIEVNLISAINPLNDEKALMNKEISKQPNKLLKIQQFEPEETFFFKKTQKEQEEEEEEEENENDDENENLNICLKEFLITPTVLAFVYKTLRNNNNNSNESDLNDHLAMNILVLVSKFILEDDLEDEEETFDESTVIQYNSTVSDLISQLRKVIFKHKQCMNKNAKIINTMSIRGFNSFLNIKIHSNNEEPKSLFDLLLEKGELGKNVLSQMSVTIIGSDNDEIKEDMKKIKKVRAQKLKEEILNQYKEATTNFNLNDDIEQDEKEKEKGDVCSICSICRKNEVLFYPLYIYRTKFPFIFDKPPLVNMSKRVSLKEAEIIEDEEILQSVDNFDIDENEEETIPDQDEMFALYLNEHPDLDITNDLDANEIERRRNLIIYAKEIIKQRHQEMLRIKKEKMRMRIEQKRIEIQKKKDELNKKISELENPDLIVSKLCTPGNLFVIQFGICQHLVHHDCVNGDEFSCPIDRSYKNGLLPNIDDLPKKVIFANENNRNYENLSNEMKEALTLFINKYSMFFRSSDDKIVDVFVELVKSISGLITTFEIRLRSLPDCLDSKKTKILSRNLFLTAWYAYRMKGKPTMKTGFINEVSENVDSKLTTFQLFIKKLIECDELEESVSQKNQSLKRILSSFINKSSLFNCDSKRGEKELCLFLRRVCLADNFLLLKNNDDKDKLIDWDEILSSENLSQKFDVSFKSIDVSGGDDFEFKPFIFTKMPKEFLRFAQKPYNFPVDQISRCIFFNILNYNKLIVNYDDLSENENDSADYLSELISIEENELNSFIRSNLSKKNYPSVILFICKNASNVAVIDGKRMKFLKPFYLDKYGCTDIGFERYQPLFLNDNRYERVMDQILSGDFSNGLDKF